MDFIVSDDSEHSINSLNNFWFCYAEAPNANKDMEAQTYYSLKGKTVSETLPYRNNGFGHTIACNSSVTNISPCIDIFNLDFTTKEIIPLHPNDPKSFKGY